MRGVEVTVWRDSASGEVDDMGEVITSRVSEVVANVLWARSTSGRIGEDGRAEGTDDSLTFHFPKTYTASLANCDIELNGEMWHVQGDPKGYMEHLTPGKWNRPVVGRKVDG